NRGRIHRHGTWFNPSSGSALQFRLVEGQIAEGDDGGAGKADTFAQADGVKSLLTLLHIDHIHIDDQIGFRSNLASIFKRFDGLRVTGHQRAVDGLLPRTVGAEPHSLSVDQPVCSENFYDHFQTPNFCYPHRRVQAATETGLRASASALSIAAPATASPMITMTGPESSLRLSRSGKSLSVPWNRRLSCRLAFSTTATAVSSCSPAPIRRAATDAATVEPI